VSFSEVGEYVLCLTANDGEFSVSDDVTGTALVYGDSDQDGMVTYTDVLHVSARLYPFGENRQAG
jgi:hypothetical protein